MSEDDQHELLIKLVTDIFRLREIITRNEEDSHLRNGQRNSGERVEFHYIIDTPIFQYFGEPKTLANYVSALPVLHVVDGDDETAGAELISDPTAQRVYGQLLQEVRREAQRTYEPGLDNAVRSANAVLTIEYIFGDLSPEFLLISPEHVREVAGYLAVLDNQARRAMMGEDRLRSQDEATHKPGGYLDLRRRLQELEKTTDAGRRTPEETLLATERVIADAITRAGHTDAFRRIDRLMARNIIANAASHPAFTSDILAPEPSYVAEWVDLVRTAKKNNKQQPTEDAFEADGATLAQLSLLNADWHEENRAFVLITDDQGLHRAYKAWMRKQREESLKSKSSDKTGGPHAVEDQDERVDFYPLRYCKQYAPMLNLRDMGGSFEFKEVFHRIKTSVFQLTDTFLSGDHLTTTPPTTAAAAWSDTSHIPTRSEIRAYLKREFRRSSDHPDERQGVLPSRAKDLEDKIRSISTEWAAAMRMACAAKVDSLKGMAIHDLEFWRERLLDLEYDNAFRANIARLTDAFDDSTAVSTMLRHEFWALNAARAGDDHLKDHGSRSVASVFSDFETSSFQGKTVAELTVQISAPDYAIADLLQAKAEERLLVLGALCLEIGAWRSASSILTQCLERLTWLESSPHRLALNHEAEFFRCIVRRVSATRRTWFKEYSELAKALDKMTGKKGAPDIDLARAASERFALAVSTFAWTTQSEQEEMAAREAVGIFTRIWKSPLAQLLKANGELPAPWPGIRDKTLLNILILGFWCIQTQGALPAVLEEAVDLALTEATATDRGPSDNALYLVIYPALIQFARSADGDDRARLAREIIQKIDEILQRDQERGYAFEVANVDKAEFRKIRGILEAQALQPAA